MSTKLAIIVGINYYASPENMLGGCINDAVNLRNMLLDAYDFVDENVMMLREDAADAGFQPTRGNIMYYLQTAIKNSAKYSEIWFTYSGHGAQIRDTSGDEADKLDEIIVPCDYKSAGFIVDDDFRKIVAQSKCPVFLLFDSCTSGSICDLPYVYNYNQRWSRTVASAANIGNQNIICMSGCKDGQTSADAYNKFSVQYNGSLTNAFVECLRFNRHNVTLDKLFRDMIQNSGLQRLDQIFTFSSTSPNPLGYTFSRANKVETQKNIYSTSRIMKMRFL